jgi:DNA-binding GntR family transcriptional regulator
MEAKTLLEIIVSYLRTRIVVYEFLPGEKMNEARLSSELNVSRPPLREAFRILENENLVQYITRRGTYVTSLSIKDCINTYRVREMMECFAIDLLKKNNIVEIPQLDKYLISDNNILIPRKDSSPEDKMAFFKATVDFHIELVKSSNNDRLVKLYRLLLPTVYRYQYLQWTSISETKEISLHDHSLVIEAIKKGEYDDAIKYLKSHINDALLMVSEQFEKHQLELQMRP